MKGQLYDKIVNSEAGRILTGIGGVAIYSIGLNLFIIPLGLYSGGLLGIGQLIRTFLSKFGGIDFGSFDIAGLLYYLLNLPLIYLAYKQMDKMFLKKLVICLTATMIFLSLIPIPSKPVVDDTLTCCLIGGIICGFGMGTYLRAGCSGGGAEIIGIILARKNPDFSVGRINIFVNAGIYTVCLIMFEPSIAIYSVIYSTISSLIMDKVHSQAIVVEAIIISKDRNKEIEQQILKVLNRGITLWEAKGGYTEERTDVMFTVLSKYEVPTLRRIVQDINPNAFMVFKEGLSVKGNFSKRL